MFCLFISPHFDDIMLSCGGLISRYISSGYKVHVVTVFSGAPKLRKFSDIAKEFHYDCNLSGSHISKVRCNEDIQASKRVGFNVTHLGFLDCLYRKSNDKFIYDKREQVFSKIIYDNTAFLNQIKSSLSLFDMNEYDLVFIPLALGNHVDHVITRQIMENIASQRDLELKIRFYEDSPYCFNVTKVCQAHSNLVSYLEEVSLEQLDTKIDGIIAYGSQFRMFWNSKQQAVNDLMTYSIKIANLQNKYYERYWKKEGL